MTGSIRFMFWIEGLEVFGARFDSIWLLVIFSGTKYLYMPHLFPFRRSR